MEFVRGLLVVGEHGHGGRVRSALFHQVAQALGENPRLPRTRRGDDPGATRGMADRGELVRRPGRLRAWQWPTAESDPASVFQRCTIRIPLATPGRSERSSVDVEGRPVGELDVGRSDLRQPPGGKTLARLCARATRSARRCGRRSCSPTRGSGGALVRTRIEGSGRGPADGRSQAPARSWSRPPAPPRRAVVRARQPARRLWPVPTPRGQAGRCGRRSTPPSRPELTYRQGPRRHGQARVGLAPPFGQTYRRVVSRLLIQESRRPSSSRRGCSGEPQNRQFSRHPTVPGLIRSHAADATPVRST